MPITLLTDFGTTDTYVGQMKGVIAGIAPNAHVIDLSHAVPAQDVMNGAIRLESAVDAFPDGSIHVGVVDPGVGSARRAIAAQTERFTFVGPDNGLFTAVWQHHPPKRIMHLNNPAYHRAVVSATFHGRDVFSPCAAHLAAGAPLEDMGEPLDSPVRLNIPEPTATGDALALTVLCVDAFGNLITNMTEATLAAYEDLSHAVLIAGAGRAHGIRRTFADVPEHEAVAYVGSSHRLELAVRNASAAMRFGVHPGDTIWLYPRG